MNWEESPEIKVETVIEVKNISKLYGKVQAVNDISLSVRKGEIFGLLGSNGAGKTTTLNMMQGVLKPDSGRITILGMDYDNSASKIKGRIGVQLQSTSLLPDLTAIQQIMLEIFMVGK